MVVGYKPLAGPAVVGVGPWAGFWVRAVSQLPSMLPGVVQSIKDHITKPTAMARGRVAHLIEWKGWCAQRSRWELSPAEDEHYCCLPDALREARFAAGQWLGAGEPGDGDWLGLWSLGDRGSPHGPCRGRAKQCHGVDRAFGGPSDHRGPDGQPSKPLGCWVPGHPGAALPPRPAVSLLSWVSLSPPRPPAGVAEQFAITEATLSAWSSLDDEELHLENGPQDMVQLQGTARVGARAGWVEQSKGWVPATKCTVTSDEPLLPSAWVSASVGWSGGSLPCPLPTGRRSIKERTSVVTGQGMKRLPSSLAISLHPHHTSKKEALLLCPFYK